MRHEDLGMRGLEYHDLEFAIRFEGTASTFRSASIGKP
jgi:hypothetical protein